MKRLKIQEILQKFNNAHFYSEGNNVFLLPWSKNGYRSRFMADLLNEDIRDCNIFLLSAEEFEFYPECPREIFTLNLKKKLIANNVFIYFIFGSANSGDYSFDQDRLYNDNKNNMRVDTWPTFWLNRTVSSNLKDQNFEYFYSKYKTDFKKDKIKYLYITMNNVAKYHRCLLIDLLAKNKMLDIGAISWRNFCLENAYEWKYTTPVRRTLSDFERYDKSTYDFQFSPPEEFFESFVSIIAETTVDLIFLTEKTATAILYKQPFLVLGAPKFHEFLKSLGFELYTEIFDYSFDNEQNLEKRTQMIIDNLNDIKDSNLYNLHTVLKPKLDKNYSRLIDIIKDNQFLPATVKNYQIFLNHYKNDLFFNSIDNML